MTYDKCVIEYPFGNTPWVITVNVYANIIQGRSYYTDDRSVSTKISLSLLAIGLLNLRIMS